MLQMVLLKTQKNHGCQLVDLLMYGLMVVAAASRKPGSPTLTLCLSSKHTNIASLLSNTAYSHMYLNIQARNENLHVLFSTTFAESAF